MRRLETRLSTLDSLDKGIATVQRMQVNTSKHVMDLLNQTYWEAEQAHTAAEDASEAAQEAAHY